MGKQTYSPMYARNQQDQANTPHSHTHTDRKYKQRLAKVLSL